MPNYDLLASSNVTSPVSQILFNSISSSYNDLILYVSSIFLDNTASPNNASFYIQANGVTTGGLYAARVLRVNSGNTVSGNGSGSQNSGELTWSADSINNTYGTSGRYDLNQYKNTNIRKQLVGGAGNSLQSGGCDGTAGWLYNDTVAITSLRFYPQRGNFTTGTQLYLYGIKESA